MNNYIFFIGGSGARTYTAFIHCAAAGAIETKNVSVLKIDADIRNSANQENKRLYEQYKKVYGLLSEENDREVFTCNIEMETEEVLSPVSTNAVTLGDAIGTSNEKRRRLLNCLYTEEEIKQSLEHGFYAHPNIGCVFFSDFAFDECLDKIENQLTNNKEVRIALVGSIFGGTGAAGIPTILKILKDRFGDRDKLRIGGVLFEPYFSVSGTNGERNNITIRTEEFYNNTYEALNYYNATKKAGFDNIYLVGQEKLDIVNDHYADGGSGQNNKPHVTEVYGALALDHFFTRIEESGVFGAVRKEILGWTDFPGTIEGERPRILKMADFARAQAVFIAGVCEYIDRKKGTFRKKCEHKNIMVPRWYKQYDLNNSDVKAKINEIGAYSASFIEWLYKVNCRYDEEGNLYPDGNMKLFGSALQNVYELLPGKGEQAAGKPDEKNKDRKSKLKKFCDSFNTFVDTTSNVEYILDKVLLVLSMAGIVSGKMAALGAAQLFLRIISLAGERKN